MREALLVSLWLAAGPAASSADALPVLHLLALSPASETAVVACEGGTGEEGDEEAVPGGPLLVRTGEEIGASGLTLVAVLPDRIEVRQVLPAEAGVPSRDRRLWVYRSRGGAASRIQVLDRIAPAGPRLGAPLPVAPHGPEASSAPSISPDLPAHRGSTAPSEPEPRPGAPTDSRPGRPAPASGEAR